MSAVPDENAEVGLPYTLSASFTDRTATGRDRLGRRDVELEGHQASQGTFTVRHTSVLPLAQHTIRLTVTDSHGALGSDSKVVTVIL